VEKLTRTFKGEVLQLCAEYDAPRIQGQNQKLFEELSKCPTMKVKKEVIPGTNHFTLIDDLRKAESQQARLLMEFIECQSKSGVK